MASFIAAYLRLLNLPVARILDVGAGVGGFQRPLVREFPGCECLGIEVSQYACARYGWQQCSIVDFTQGRFDLVICHDVAQYLCARDAAQALSNLADRVSRRALFQRTHPRRLAR